MINSYSPVVVFVYNRPEHTRRTLEGLASAIGASQTEIYIFSDGSRGKKDVESVDKTRKIINEYVDDSRFKSVRIIYRKENLGLGKSVINGVSEVIERFGKVIVMEDDLVAQPGLLVFLNGALDYYKDNKKIWSVSGFTVDLKALHGYRHDVYFGYRGSSYAWGTWSDRWSGCDWRIKDYSKFKYNMFARRRFNKGGADMSGMLDAQMVGIINSWAIRWNYNQFKKDMYTVFPCKSLVECIGYDGSGVHCGDVHTSLKQRIWDKDKDFIFEDFFIDKTVNKQFWRYFSGRSPLAINCVVRSFVFLFLGRMIVMEEGRLKFKRYEELVKYL